MNNLHNAMIISALLILSVAVVVVDIPEASADSELVIDNADYSDGLLIFSGNAKSGKVVTLWITQDGQKVSPYMDLQPDANGGFSKKVRINLDNGLYVLNARQSNSTVTINVTVGVHLDYAGFDGTVLRFCGVADPGIVVSSWVEDSDGKKMSPIMDTIPGSDGKFFSSVTVNLTGEGLSVHSKQAGVECTSNIEKTEAPRPILDKTKIVLDASAPAVITVSSCLEDNAEYVWSSSSQKICTVDENGTVRAVSAGTAEIRVKMTFGSEVIGSAVCSAVVSYMPLQIDTGDGFFVEGSSMGVSVVVPHSMSKAEIEWIPSDSALKIGGDGSDVILTSTKPGNYTVSVIVGGLYKAEFNVIVTKAPYDPDGGSGTGPDEPTVEEHENPDGSVTIITTTKKTDANGNDVLIKNEVTDRSGAVTEVTYETVTDINGNLISSEISGKSTHLNEVSGNSVVVEFKKSVDANGKTERTDEISIESKSRIMKTHSIIKSGDGDFNDLALVTEFECGDTIDADIIDDVLVQHGLAFSSGLPSDAGRLISANIPDGTSAEFTCDAIQKILGCGAKLKVEGGDGSIEVDHEIVSTLVGDGSASVKLSLKANATESLKEKQRQVIGDRHFVDLNAFSGDRSIHELGGKAIVTFGYSLGTGESSEDLCVYHVDEDGVKTPVDSVYRDGRFSMAVDHFSIFMVDSINAESGISEETNDYWMLPAVVILAVAVVAVAAVVHIRRN